MADLTTAFWGMTINNYDETDLAMVQNGYPDHMRELVYTLEEGAEGTRHIQAYLKLKRQQRLSFVKKLFPRGHFKALCSAEYQQNSKVYAQKLDGTARSPAVHKFQDPIHTIEGLVRQVIRKMIEEYPDVEDLDSARSRVERDMVIDDYTMAKIFVSSTYKQMWKHFGHNMYQCLFHQREAQLLQEELAKRRVSFEDTHTHTHTGEKFSHEGGITNGASRDSSPRGSDTSDSGSEPEDDGSEGFEDDFCSSDEGQTESSGECSGEEDDESED